MFKFVIYELKSKKEHGLHIIGMWHRVRQLVTLHSTAASRRVLFRYTIVADNVQLEKSHKVASRSTKTCKTSD